MKLVVKDTGEHAVVGKKYTDFRGNVRELLGGTPPRHSASTGRVRLEDGEYFPSVIGLAWVEGKTA